MTRINFFGDFVGGKHEYGRCGRGNGNMPQGPELSSELQAMIDRAEINVINYEAPCLYYTARTEPRPKSGPHIYQHPDSVHWIERHGLNVVSMANNHIMDYGELGLQDSRSSFRHARTGGAGTWEEAYRPVLINVNGGG